MAKASVVVAVVVVATLVVGAAYYLESSGVSSNADSSGYVTSSTASTFSRISNMVELVVMDVTTPNGSSVQIEPSSFILTEGVLVVLALDNTDDSPHELLIPGLEVNTGIVQGSTTIQLSFTPTVVGTFEFYQPPGACVSAANPAAGCTGAQDLNGTVTVVAAPI